jgi:biotin operon repressor
MMKMKMWELTLLKPVRKNSKKLREVMVTSVDGRQHSDAAVEACIKDLEDAGFTVNVETCGFERNAV